MLLSLKNIAQLLFTTTKQAKTTTTTYESPCLKIHVEMLSGDCSGSSLGRAYIPCPTVAIV